ncbi:MAG: hypothetical protein A3F09_00780 [Chlamydiae bacterium RIFCSPHIGHO2_12_FULL_49_11]|nr:MAG: hypothetical protein A3F09_00780 [Chlamydiae bacterium RIFCSPHIGHO2_12_FULL_49_11]
MGGAKAPPDWVETAQPQGKSGDMRAFKIFSTVAGVFSLSHDLIPPVPCLKRDLARRVKTTQTNIQLIKSKFDSAVLRAKERLDTRFFPFTLLSRLFIWLAERATASAYKRATLTLLALENSLRNTRICDPVVLDGFATLPLELKQQVLSHLPAIDRLRTRRVSREFCTLIHEIVYEEITGSLQTVPQEGAPLVTRYIAALSHLNTLLMRLEWEKLPVISAVFPKLPPSCIQKATRMNESAIATFFSKNGIAVDFPTQSYTRLSEDFFFGREGEKVLFYMVANLLFRFTVPPKKFSSALIKSYHKSSSVNTWIPEFFQIPLVFSLDRLAAVKLLCNPKEYRERAWVGFVLMNALESYNQIPEPESRRESAKWMSELIFNVAGEEVCSSILLRMLQSPNVNFYDKNLVIMYLRLFPENRTPLLALYSKCLELELISN